MGPTTSPPDERARSIFDGLGYEVTGSGTEFSATRDWKRIDVSVVADGGVSTEGDRYRCFVTWDERVEAVTERLRRADPNFEWAVIGVAAGEDVDYEVARAPPVS
ncbi:MAG: hypothetical protein ABEJ77_03920 [Halanaeroarchaeum sp.]